MAVSLILRNSVRIQNYPNCFRYTSAALKTTCSFNENKERLPLNDAQKMTITKFSNGTLLTPAVRRMSSDHRMIWKAEKLVSLALVGFIPATIITATNPILDNITSVLMVMHIHWGLEAMAQDYVRPILFGNVISKTAVIIVYALTASTLGGLLFFNYSDIGLGCAIRSLWSIRG